MLANGVRNVAVLAALALGPFAWGQSAGLFDQDEVFTISLSGNLTELLKDRSGDPTYYPLTLSYKAPDSSIVTIPLRARTRGNFRRAKGTCAYPPLLLNFSKEAVRNTVFQHQDKVKLVMPCQGGDKYVVREYLVYKLYNEISLKSFQTRLVRIVLEDDNLKVKGSKSFYGILLEEEDQMANRNNMVSIDRKLVRPEQTQLNDFITMAVFEYMIGNTDWSVQYRQNVKLMAEDTLARPYTVPYDFDHAGIVDAPYAKPAAELELSSVRIRRYRGFCMGGMNPFESIFARLNELKTSLYAVYETNNLIDEAYRKSTLKYLDDFYKTINDPKRAKEEFLYPCRKDGTGNVVIKGLNKD